VRNLRMVGENECPIVPIDAAYDFQLALKGNLISIFILQPFLR